MNRITVDRYSGYGHKLGATYIPLHILPFARYWPFLSLKVKGPFTIKGDIITRGIGVAFVGKPFVVIIKIRKLKIDTFYLRFSFMSNLGVFFLFWTH